MAFLTDSELMRIGFKTIGKNVKISEKASIYNPAQIVIGSNTRIDDFCILSAGLGGIEIGSHVHISCYSALIGKGRIVLEDFAGLSGKCSVFSGSDDFSGKFLTNPTVPEKFTNVRSAPVILKRHAIVGAGTIILPGVTLGEGAAVGALSLVVKDLEPFSINIGVPAKKIKARRRDLLKLEQEFLASSLEKA